MSDINPGSSYHFVSEKSLFHATSSKSSFWGESLTILGNPISVYLRNALSPDSSGIMFVGTCSLIKISPCAEIKACVGLS
ncbi:hypothetical protein BABINDRAFT_160882, partial [Babjeviella inositovora NRRL Y-12698]